ncbi:peroxiredoxin [Devosia sp.]|uniref:peroxiredoxin n=1 Tax=Devosia sp. TaxID=1871048 RepID=UPI003BAA5DCF
MSVPAIGTPAPDFELMTDSRELFRLSAHKGQMVVLYFYPQDDTEGCTLENIEFTDLLPEFKALKAAVVGISPDTIEKHCTFRDKYNLGVPLASDPDRTVISAYGLWQLKKLYGVEFMGVKRATVVIDTEGRIAEVLYATRIKGHAEKVLAAARALANPTDQAGKTPSKTKR